MKIHSYFILPFIFKYKFLLNNNNIKYCHSDIQCKLYTKNIDIKCCHISSNIFVCCQPNDPKFRPIPISSSYSSPPF